MAVLPQQVPPHALPTPMPGAGPSPMPGAPAAPPGVPGMNMLAAKGAGGAQSPAGMAMLLFLAGMGYPEYVRAMDKQRNPGGHKSAAGKEAAANPQMTNPAAAAQLAQLAALKRQMPGTGVPMAAPPPNPMAMFGR